MKMKTSELTGVALDYAVSKCDERSEPELLNDFATAWFTWGNAHYSTNWALAGPIIEREKIDLNYFPDGSYENGGAWMATLTNGPAVSEEVGPTPLVAAMRCYVASKLGDEVEVPDELA